MLEATAKHVQPGRCTLEIDNYARELIKSHGAKSAFYKYKGFPRHTCISVNEEVVHGVAGSRVLSFGDIVSLDVGVVFGGFVGDVAKTVVVGGCSAEAQQLLDVTKHALYLGIREARSGARVSAISAAIQCFVERNGYSVVREFVGHGVGRSIHEDPQIPNFVENRASSPVLRSGMTVAIEPMVNAGGAAITEKDDGWTVVTRDGCLSAHFEHTVLITDGEAEVLTHHETCSSGFRI